MYNERKDEKGKIWSNTLTKPQKYAYNWLLTSVTGPDFVDKNNNGLADTGDYGYWVRFEYNQWMKDFKWRNPAVGFNKDIDGDFQFYSYGQKEVYYLDKIFTESHVALFEKSQRNDGREVSSLYSGGFDPYKIPGKQTCFAECFASHSTETADIICNNICKNLPDDQLNVLP